MPEVIAPVPSLLEAPPSARPEVHAIEAPQPPSPGVHASTAREEPTLFARRTTWGWLSLGASAFSLAGTVIAWRIGESAAERWNDDNRCLRNGGTRAENCGADEDTAKAARTWTTAGLIATGVFGATATILLWPGQQRSERAATRAQCVVAGVGLACALRL